MGIQSAVVGGGDTYAGRREPRDVEMRYNTGRLDRSVRGGRGAHLDLDLTRLLPCFLEDETAHLLDLPLVARAHRGATLKLHGASALPSLRLSDLSSLEIGFYLISIITYSLLSGAHFPC